MLKVGELLTVKDTVYKVISIDERQENGRTIYTIVFEKVEK